MKYNRSEIMKKAWSLFRTTMSHNSFATCLKESWKIAKAAAERETFTGKKPVIFRNYEFRFWMGGKARRIYINGTKSNGSYIDLTTMKPVLSRKANWDLAGTVEAFLAKYEIAC